MSWRGSVSLVPAGPDDHTDKEITQEWRSSKRPEPPASSPTSGAPNSYTTSRDLTAKGRSSASEKAKRAAEALKEPGAGGRETADAPTRPQDGGHGDPRP